MRKARVKLVDSTGQKLTTPARRMVEHIWNLYAKIDPNFMTLVEFQEYFSGCGHAKMDLGTIKRKIK